MARARTNASIAMVVHAYYPLAEPRVEREAKAARDGGYEVEVICLRGTGEARRDVVDGIVVRRAPLRHVRGAGFIRLLAEYGAFTVLAAGMLAFRRFRPAIVHVHTPPDFLALAALPLVLRGSRLVVDIHDLSPHLYEARFAPGLRMRTIVGTLRALERLACGLAEGVITVHEPYRRELLADGVAPGKVTVVMNSPDPRVIEQARANGGSETREGFTVAYHGTITAWYGVDLVVEALDRIRDRIPGARAIILGDGDALSDVQDRAEAAGLDGRIEFSGRYVPLADALRRVATAHCGVIPNRATTLNRFALSSKLFEYVALGIPVVVARLETLAAHFSPDEVTFFDPGDADSLARALEWVASHPVEARAKAERARSRAVAYSWEANAARYLDVLRGA